MNTEKNKLEKIECDKVVSLFLAGKIDNFECLEKVNRIKKHYRKNEKEKK